MNESEREQKDLTINSEGKDRMFAAGFLYTSDFTPDKKLLPLLGKRPLSTIQKIDGSIKNFRISMCLKKSDEIPEGFFIYSSIPVIILNAELSRAVIGFDRAAEIPYAAFSSEGGSTDFNCTEFDFTNAVSNFTVKNSASEIFPVIKLELVPETQIGTWDKQKKIKIYYGKERLTVKRSLELNSITLQTAAFKEPYALLNFSECSESILSVFLYANSQEHLPVKKNEKECVLSPLTSDIGLIFDYPKQNWRCQDYELFSWELFPDVLFFDFRTYAIQNKFFTRLAFFVEKAGYKGTLISDKMVKSVHGYNAHDYKPEDLAAFFTKAFTDKFTLNDEELLLKDILLYNKVIIENPDGTFSKGKGAIVSISQESEPYRRILLSAHECWHGIYFNSQEFQDLMVDCYANFDTQSLDFIKVFWQTQKGLEYDTKDEYLMKNELMAYILQSIYPQCIRNYFIQLTNRKSVLENEKELALYVKKNKAQAFVDCGTVLNQFIFNKWGLTSGRVNLISR